MKTLYLDIETVPAYKSYYDMPGTLQECWKKKHNQLNSDLTIPESYFENAALYPEFSKVVCISLEYQEESELIKQKFIYNADEKQILHVFDIISSNKLFSAWCAFNGKNYDFPYLAKRYIINGMPVPKWLRVGGRKPWELTHLIDPLETWKFGSFSGGSNLRTIAFLLLGIDPKTEFDGGKVKDFFYSDASDEEKEKVIGKYCQGDTTTLRLIHKRLSELC